MMGREHKITEVAFALSGHGILGSGSRRWHSGEGMDIEFFGLSQAESLNEDLEVWRKMPGWCVIGQDGDDALICYEGKSGRCAMVEADDICVSNAQELSGSILELLAQGQWSSS